MNHRHDCTKRLTSSQTNNHTTLKLEHLAVGEPVPCYVRSITVTSGNAYLLA